MMLTVTLAVLSLLGHRAERKWLFFRVAGPEVCPTLPRLFLQP